MTRALSVSLCVLSSPRNVVKFFLKEHSHFFKNTTRTVEFTDDLLLPTHFLCQAA